MIRSLKQAQNIIINVKFPNKFKGTIVERWADYWKNLFIDYRQMLQDLRSDIQDEPKKAMIWCTGIVIASFLAKKNPDEIDFKNDLKTIVNEVNLVSEECRNPKSIEHLRFLSRSYNEGILHYRSFGLASIIYTSELNDTCDLYKAHCKYLKPNYLNFPIRIVDVGFIGRWWNIFIKTTNYDVNM